MPDHRAIRERLEDSDCSCPFSLRDLISLQHRRRHYRALSDKVWRSLHSSGKLGSKRGRQSRQRRSERRSATKASPRLYGNAPITRYPPPTSSDNPSPTPTPSSSFSGYSRASSATPTAASASKAAASAAAGAHRAVRYLPRSQPIDQDWTRGSHQPSGPQFSTTTRSSGCISSSSMTCSTHPP